MLPHLTNGWQVDQAILSEEERVSPCALPSLHSPTVCTVAPVCPLLVCSASTVLHCCSVQQTILSTLLIFLSFTSLSCSFACDNEGHPTHLALAWCAHTQTKSAGCRHSFWPRLGSRVHDDGRNAVSAHPFQLKQRHAHAPSFTHSHTHTL
jgi:hypothetical protein